MVEPVSYTHLELAGGTISSEIKDVCAAPAKDFRVELAYEKVNSLIGKVIPVDTIKSRG